MKKYLLSIVCCLALIVGLKTETKAQACIPAFCRKEGPCIYCTTTCGDNIKYCPTLAPTDTDTLVSKYEKVAETTKEEFKPLMLSQANYDDMSKKMLLASAKRFDCGWPSQEGQCIITWQWNGYTCVKVKICPQRNNEQPIDTFIGAK